MPQQIQITLLLSSPLIVKFVTLKLHGQQQRLITTLQRYSRLLAPTQPWHVPRVIQTAIPVERQQHVMRVTLQIILLQQIQTMPRLSSPPIAKLVTPRQPGLLRHSVTTQQQPSRWSEVISG